MEPNNKLVFKKINYMLMLAGIALLVIGFVIMTLETAPYGFGALGLTVGPMFIFAGFFVEFFAILYRPKK